MKIMLMDCKKFITAAKIFLKHSRECKKWKSRLHVTYRMYAITPTLHRSATGVTDSSRATSGEQNSGEAYFTRSLRFGLYLRANPKSITFSSSEDGLERSRFSGCTQTAKFHKTDIKNQRISTYNSHYLSYKISTDIDTG